ncbi:MAG: TDT family transporter [Actinomycetaceae bacterium]|nr:TDT family transporter [Actinomycetaceae bacterium]
MKTMLKKMPLPVAGTAFGMTGAGGLLSHYVGSWITQTIFSAAGIALLLLVIAKLILFRPQFLENLENPIQAAVTATAILVPVLISGYIGEHNPSLALVIWSIAFALYVPYMLWFTWKYIVNFDLKKVFAPFFIPFVALSVFSMVSKNFMNETVRVALFWIAFAFFLALLVTITIRYIKLPDVPTHARPAFAVYAAPISMLLVVLTRLENQAGVPAWFYTTLAVAAQIAFLVVLTRVPSFLKKGFFPSFAALTFPFIITAIGAIESLPVLASYSLFTHPVFTWIAYAEVVFALLMTLYVFIRYIIFLNSLRKSKED